VDVTSASRVLLVLGASLAVVAVVAVVSYGASSQRTTALSLRAFTRSAVASDALPHKPYASLVVLRSRRVATYTDRHGRSTSLFVYEAKGRFERGASKEQVWFCTLSFSQAAEGGGCAPIQVASSEFVTHPLDADWGAIPYDGEYVWGVAANNVRTAVLTESRGVRHKIALSADNGFIYNCGVKGCAGSIDSYSRHGQLLSTLPVRPIP
jgi:hypothetical protein